MSGMSHREGRDPRRLDSGASVISTLRSLERVVVRSAGKSKQSRRTAAQLPIVAADLAVVSAVGGPQAETVYVVEGWKPGPPRAVAAPPIRTPEVVSDRRPDVEREDHPVGRG